MRSPTGVRANLAALVLAGLAAAVAGWFWTIGHVAGPVAAVYLWMDGRRRCRLAAVAPLAATTLAVALTLALGGRHIDSTISFHGRDARTAGSTRSKACSTRARPSPKTWSSPTSA